MTVTELIQKLQELNIPNAVVIQYQHDPDIDAMVGVPLTGFVYDDKELEIMFEESELEDEEC